MFKNSKYRFLRKLTKKYRLAVIDNGTFKEKVVVKTTPLLVFLFGVIISFIMVFFVFLLIIKTPLKDYISLKDYIPGKTTQETHNDFIMVSAKVDSLSVLLERKNLYLENLRIILNGGVPLSKYENNFSDLNEKDYVSISPNNSVHFFSPLLGSFTDKYNWNKNHFGVDIVSEEGSIINSIADGVVVINNWTKETGFIVAVHHSKGFLSFYKHCSKILKNVGDFVEIGEGIAIIGGSGELSSGPHLHFELWKNGESLNPEDYILF